MMTPPPPAPEVAPQVSGGKIWSFVKYGLIAAVTGTTGYAGYLSYKCSCEEVDHKAKALRAAASYTPSEDASANDKYGGLLYSAAMTGDDLIGIWFALSSAWRYSGKNTMEAPALGVRLHFIPSTKK
ncbi:hypothetical protein PVK06_018390 [Gossypium arboreum]|uniref:Uncharacterized protein n=1 Tax=Gossypium arboreum TaxID=29729 RepID=A0ABR0Q5C1_GOSAR|nr:hypothetical protein PVK06_018390 [Gossypium arboreum]